MAATTLAQRECSTSLGRSKAGQSFWFSSPGIFLISFLLLLCAHISLLGLPYFWDEAGYYIPAARDLLAGSVIPFSTPSNAHPPLVMASLALAWKLFGQSLIVTRCAMLAITAFSLTGYFRLARTISNLTIAAWATALVAMYPVFFAQSSLAQVDLPAAGLAFWGLDAYFRQQRFRGIVWFSLAALAKETAILVPFGLCVCELLRVALPSRDSRSSKDAREESKRLVTALAMLAPAIPLALWYAYHRLHTGFIFGNPEFLRYNLQGNFTPLRIVLALLLRLWQTLGYLNLYVLTLACVVAMRYPAQRLSSAPGSGEQRPAPSHPRVQSEHLRYRIEIPVQLALLTVTTVYLLAMSVLGGAVLARYMLPIVPLVILICVSTIWRRLRFWKAVLGIAALSFLAALLYNPPYGFSPEDNLAYADYIRLHQKAESFIAARYPHARVLTAWPASDELSRPYLGYAKNAMKVVRIEDFTPEQLMSAADAHSRFDVALVFSTKYQPPHSLSDHWQLWQKWKTRFFGYHVDLPPKAAAAVLGGELVYEDGRSGQWVGIIQMESIEEAHADPRTKRSLRCHWCE